MLKNSTILVTGGTGSFGKKFVSMTLKNMIQIDNHFSRDEMKRGLWPRTIRMTKGLILLSEM